MHFTYKTIANPTESLFKDRGSKFLGFAYPIKSRSDVKEYLDVLKKEHLKAVHYCYAYRLGTDGLDYRANDDGEPSGSAGKPILGQIDSFGYTNVLVIVVRYFGGTLLGVPGLINAYKIATLECLQQAQSVEKVITKPLSISFEYPLLGEIMNIVKQHNIEIATQEMLLFCKMTLDAPLENYEMVIGKIKELLTVEIMK